MSDADIPSTSIVAALSHAAKAEPRGITDVTILRDGEEAFPAMMDLIASATSQIQFENFIFAGDQTGRRFATALADAAKRGVDVQVLYDPVGTLMVRGGSIARELRRLGVTARAFRPVSLHSPRSWLGLRHRDHRKTLTADGVSGIVGGLCISDNWSPVEHGGYGWRDTAVLVRGEVVTDVKRAFEALWDPDRRSASELLSARSTPSTTPAAFVISDQPGLRRVGDLYTWFAHNARRNLDITDAYMVLPRRALNAIAAAAKRGVAVRLLLPGRNNHRLAGAAARHGYSDLMAAGVEIWEWKGAMVHAKTAVVDRTLTLVGSSNLDPLSLRRNYELNLLIADAATGAGMHAMFEHDLDNATRIEPTLWARRPRTHRIAERLGRLLAANL